MKKFVWLRTIDWILLFCYNISNGSNKLLNPI
jgi:hypothetical protein